MMFDVSAITPTTGADALGRSQASAFGDDDTELDIPFMAEMEAQSKEINLMNAEQRAIMNSLLNDMRQTTTMEMLERMTLQARMSIADRETSAQMKRLTGKFQLIDDMLQKIS